MGMLRDMNWRVAKRRRSSPSRKEDDVKGYETSGLGEAALRTAIGFVVDSSQKLPQGLRLLSSPGPKRNRAQKSHLQIQQRFRRD